MRDFLQASSSGPLGTEARSLVSSRRGGPTLKRALGLVVLALGALVVAAGSAASREGSAAAPARVKVTMTDYAFALSKKVVRKGTVVFTVVNNGEVVHDFKIAGRKTPIYEAGQSGALRVVFKKVGRYPFICTIPGHVAIGMKGVLKVVK
jgi:uncharacterized cupredoxin-like copper-binding protein